MGCLHLDSVRCGSHSHTLICFRTSLHKRPVTTRCPLKVNKLNSSSISYRGAWGVHDITHHLHSGTYAYNAPESKSWHWGEAYMKTKENLEKCPDGTYVGANMSLFFFILQRKWNPHLKNALLLESLGKFMQFFLINMFLQRHIKKNVRIISAERVLKHPFLYFFYFTASFLQCKKLLLFTLYCRACGTAHQCKFRTFSTDQCLDG